MDAHINNISRRGALGKVAAGVAVGGFAGLLPAAPANAATTPAGKVSRMRGKAEAFRNPAVMALAEGSDIMTGDMIETLADTRVEITFADNSVLTLGDGSRITIDAFVYNPAAAEGRQTLTLAKGVFRMVSGGVGKLAGTPFAVRTPVATIGIRGTDFWGHQSAERLDLALLGGAGIYAENATGRIDITQLRGLTSITGYNAKPSPVVVLSQADVAKAAQTVSF